MQLRIATGRRKKVNNYFIAAAVILIIYSLQSTKSITGGFISGAEKSVSSNKMEIADKPEDVQSIIHAKYTPSIKLLSNLRYKEPPFRQVGQYCR